MTELYHFQMVGLFEAKAPIIHTEETIGNVQRIKRIKVLNVGNPVLVPALSGNSFRGQLRDLIGDHFIEMVHENKNSQNKPPIDNKPSNDKLQMNHLMYGVLFSGGVMHEKHKGPGNKMKDLMEHVPMLRVLGSAFGNRMMPSKISVSHIVPIAKETESYLGDTLAELPKNGHALIERLANYRANLPVVEELTFEEGPLTRKKDEENPILTRNVELSGQAVKQQQMIYHVECISCGTMLLQRIGSRFPLSKMELGCLLDGLRSFARSSTVGGRGAAGYGRVEFTYYLTITPIDSGKKKNEGNDSQKENDKDDEKHDEWKEGTRWLDKATLNGALPAYLQDMLNEYHQYVKTNAQCICKVLGPDREGNREHSTGTPESQSG